MSIPDPDIERWRSQSRKGFLELCVMALIRERGRAYGLDAMERLAGCGLEVSEGTLYPLLLRLTKDGLLAAEWTTPDTGHPRKYYRLSERGLAACAEMEAEYGRNHAAFTRITGRKDE